MDNEKVIQILNCWLRLQSNNLEIWIWKYKDILAVLDLTLQQYRGIFRGLNKLRAMYVLPMYIIQIFGGYFGFVPSDLTTINLPILRNRNKNVCYLFLPPAYFSTEKHYPDYDFSSFSVHCESNHPFLRLHNRMIVLTRNEINLHDAVGWNVLKKAQVLSDGLKEYKKYPISIRPNHYLAISPDAIQTVCQNSTSKMSDSINFAGDKLKIDWIKEYLENI
ncbi:unnamed protein product [Dimorphilus gyrociliatus]|uniref:Uncharacterized protein n=1 Tax=Dimorphilus gyrociliatus TaxID=2664684 RepID=A0A7I8W5B6_9ANNE|nr:unnamed protein product [Dimorphilus gyrociliatus]